MKNAEIIDQLPVVKDTAVCYVTDSNFLLCTLLSASLIGENSRYSELVDIFICLVGFEECQHDKLKALFHGKNIQFLPMKATDYDLGNDCYFEPSHVPKSSLGRLALHKVLPDGYSNIVYLDGDTYIVDSVESLLTHRVKPGHILAANEFLWLCEGERGAFWKKHMDYLSYHGIDKVDAYFNSGVFALKRETLAESSESIINYFRKHAGACLYHDQSALNAYFYGRREIMSPRYNYSLGFYDLNRMEADQPAVLHFTGGEKPWKTKASVWPQSIINAYLEFSEKHAELSPFGLNSNAIQPKSSTSTVRRILQSIRRQKRSKLMHNYMNETEFAF
jgi:lipopolysaccharide biosynthesis glycosyltransferase|tara:strand:+ start:1089 stop:2090 length:1002 start_codon:yes stop_codon:yes gene_type:complete